MAGITCRCNICGKKNADSGSRKHYIEGGIAPDERKPKGKQKRQERRMLRHRLKQWFREERD